MDKNVMDSLGIVSRPKPSAKTGSRPKRNEDYAKYGAGHTRLTIEDFLKNKANVVPDIPEPFRNSTHF